MKPRFAHEPLALWPALLGSQTRQAQESTGQEVATTQHRLVGESSLKAANERCNQYCEMIMCGCQNAAPKRTLKGDARVYQEAMHHRLPERLHKYYL